MTGNELMMRDTIITRQATRTLVRVALRIIPSLTFGMTLANLADASQVIALCDDPSGYQLLHGPGLPPDEIFHGEGQAAKFGSKPSFIIDDQTPSELIVIWGSAIHPELNKDLTETLDLRAKAEVASVIRRTNDHVLAIQEFSNGIYVYSLFFKLGYGVFSKHSKQTNGSAAAWLYFGKCKFEQR